MLNIDVDEVNGIVTLIPKGALSKIDFENAAGIIDPYLEKNEKLNGLIIHTKTFPGWESLGSLIKHIGFVKEHHKKVRRVALVTDSVLGKFGEKMAGCFLSPEIKYFAFAELNKARSWILNSESK